MSNSVDGGEILFEMRADGSQLQEEIKKTQDALNNLGAQSSDTENSLGGIARASKKTQVDLKGIGDASKKTNIDLKSMSGEGISAVAAGLSTVNPKVGALVGLFGQLRVLSGPLAVALGVVSLAYKEFTRRQEELKAAQERAEKQAQAYTAANDRLRASQEALAVATGELLEEEAEIARVRREAYTRDSPAIMRSGEEIIRLNAEIAESRRKIRDEISLETNNTVVLTRAREKLFEQMQQLEDQIQVRAELVALAKEQISTDVAVVQQIDANTAAKKAQAEADKDAADAARERIAANKEGLAAFNAELNAVASESGAVIDRTVADLDKALTEIEQATIRDQEAIGQGISDTLTGVSNLSMTLANQVAEDNEKAAKRLFRVSQAAGLADVAVNTAVSITKALAQLGPIAGPIAAIGLTATGAAQAATILAQKPPTAHVGTGLPGSSDSLAPDERLSFGRRVLRTESSQPAGVANSMGTQLINDVNTGRLGGGGGGQITAVIGRTHLDTELFQSGRRGTSRFSRMLRTNPHPNPQGGY